MFAFSPRRFLGPSCLGFAALILASSIPLAEASDGLLLPPAPVGPGGEDSITTSEGVRCSQSINSNGGYVDFGVAGGDLSGNNYGYSNGQQSAIGYARVVVPLGEAPRRLDCNRLYELEIQRLKAEIQLLQMGVQ